MFKKKLKNNIYISILLLTALVAISAFMLSRSPSNISQILGIEESLGFEYYLILFIFALIFLASISSIFVLIRQIVKFDKTAFTIDEDGIHDTFIGITLFALIIIVPVKLIPWNSIREINVNNGKPRAKIDSKEVIASPVAKLILKTCGFDFDSSTIDGGLNENEIEIISSYCSQIPDCIILKKEIIDESNSYSKKAKAGMTILVIINALFLLLTFLDYSLTAGMSCSITSLLAVIFDASEHPLFAEACQIVENNSFYFQIHENYLHDIWTVLKIAHIAASVGFIYLMERIKPKISSKKLTLAYILCTVIIALSGMTVLQFAVHNRTEANENNVIISEYGKEDTVITNYNDAEKVKVYIIKTYGDDRYLSYEGAVDVTANGKTYTFFGTESPNYEDMEKFINLFDESIVEIDKTYWGTEEFETDDTYLDNQEIFDRIFK